jgi:hypothetical protein
VVGIRIGPDSLDIFYGLSIILSGVFLMRIVFIILVFIGGFCRVSAQTVVEMSLPEAIELLNSHKLSKGTIFLTKLANNYRQLSNVRVQSRWHEESIATLAKALRTDFDGSGNDYIKDMTIWTIIGNAGHKIYIAASSMDKNAVLLSSDLDYLKGMIAYEILHQVQQGHMNLRQAQKKALDVGIEMQVTQDYEGKPIISFFGHGDNEQLVGKLMIFEPIDFVWK